MADYFLLPLIHPGSMPSAEITSYKPTYQDLARTASYRGLGDKRISRCESARVEPGCCLGSDGKEWDSGFDQSPGFSTRNRQLAAELAQAFAHTINTYAQSARGCFAGQFWR
jgi:hypothetical protein